MHKNDPRQTLDVEKPSFSYIQVLVFPWFFPHLSLGPGFPMPRLPGLVGDLLPKLGQFDGQALIAEIQEPAAQG